MKYKNYIADAFRNALETGENRISETVTEAATDYYNQLREFIGEIPELETVAVAAAVSVLSGEFDAATILSEQAKEAAKEVAAS